MFKLIETNIHSYKQFLQRTKNLLQCVQNMDEFSQECKQTQNFVFTLILLSNDFILIINNKNQGQKPIANISVLKPGF